MDRVVESWRGATASCKTLSALLLATYLLHFVVPGSVFEMEAEMVLPPRFHVWRFVTASYYETSIWSVLASMGALFTMGKQLESVWGQKEYIKFIVVVNFAVVSLSFLTVVGTAIVFRTSMQVFETFTGFMGATTALVIGFKQLFPTAEVHVLFMPFSIQYFPLAISGVSFLLLVMGRMNQGLFPLFGLICGWVYLRYYQVVGERVGDLSEDFAFASFFPPLLRPYVGRVSNVIYKLLVLAKCCPPVVTSIDASGQYHSVPVIPPTRVDVEAAVPLPGSDAQQAERRRQRALMTLEGRLGKLAKQEGEKGGGGGGASTLSSGQDAATLIEDETTSVAS